MDSDTSTTEPSSIAASRRSLKGSYFIAVPGYTDLLNTARARVNAGHTTMTVLGPYGSGAAEACRRVSRSLAEARGGLFVELATTGVSDSRPGLKAPAALNRTRPQVMRELLASFGLRLNYTHKEDLAERVSRMLAVRSQDHGGNLNVFIDLRVPDSLSDLLHLDYLEDRLRRFGCAAHFVVLLAALSSQQVRQFLTPSWQAVGVRWLAAPAQWEQLPAGMLAGFMRSYDRVVRRGELAPITQVFAPVWWEQGWRMESLAPEMLKALDIACREAGRGGCTSVPIGHLVRVCEDILSNAQTEYASPAEAVSRATRASDLALFWRLQS
jgi:hypothetical protein